jgi:hypothetical protein
VPPAEYEAQYYAELDAAMPCSDGEEAGQPGISDPPWVPNSPKQLASLLELKWSSTAALA